MSRGVNKAQLLGYVGKDPEIRSSQSGMTIATFSLATSDRQKDQSGNWVDKTEWHNLVAFGRTAEIVRDYVSKGSHLFVEGKIQTRSWDDRESGQKKYRTEILVNELNMLGGGDRDQQQPRSGYQSGGNRGNAHQGGNSGRGGYDRNSGPGDTSFNTGDYSDQGISDDDIPF